MSGVFAEFETNLRCERQFEGVAANLYGAYAGWKKAIDDAEIQRLRFAKNMRPIDISRQLGIGRRSVYRAIFKTKPVAVKMTESAMSVFANVSVPMYDASKLGLGN